MNMTSEDKRALAYIVAADKRGDRPSVREIQRALNKKSYSHTTLILGRLRRAGLVEWQRMMRRTIRPVKKGCQATCQAKMFIVGERVKWPFSTWRSVNCLWLDPLLFHLDPAAEHIVVEVGRDWNPQYLRVGQRDRIIVSRRLPDIPKNIEKHTILLHREGLLVAAKLFSEGGWLTREPQRRVEREDILGIVVAVISPQISA